MEIFGRFYHHRHRWRCGIFGGDQKFWRISLRRTYIVMYNDKNEIVALKNDGLILFELGETRTNCYHIGTNVTNTDRFAQVVLDDGHLL